MYDERYGRFGTSKARNPYTCGVTGKTYTSKQVPERIDLLARAIAKRLGFSPNEGTEWDRVVAVYSVNTVRTAFSLGGRKPGFLSRFSKEPFRY